MIAKGGMAEVYRARTTGLQGFEKEVCVKKILPHLTEDESFITMFINEAKLAASLNCANIVQVHDLCVSDVGEYFIVMEFVEGKDLSDVIRATQLAGREIPPEIAVHITREVCQGLAYAHTRTDRDGAPLNITHRDMSPHNVLVSYVGEVKIVDFGIAKASSIVSQTAVGILKGKYGYMSPEQARGQPVDARSDIFNTGIVLYEMLVGERCFAGSSDFSTLNLMRNAEVSPPTSVNANVPKSLEKIVLKILSKEKKTRPQTALELDKILGDWVRAENALVTRADLTEFICGLFKPNETPAKASGGTGVLEMQSVGESEKPSLTPKGSPSKKPPRGSTKRAPSLADQPVNNAPSNPPKPAKPKDPAPTPGKPAKEEKSPKAEKPTTPPAPKVKSPPPPAKASPKAPEEKKVPVPVAKKAENADKKKPTPKVAAMPAPPKKKQLTNKAPIGRRHLRPGHTKPSGVNRQRRQAALRVASILIGFIIFGAVVGRLRARAASQEKIFRQMELSNRREAVPGLGLVLIRSVPSGMEVRLDGVRLLHPTPVAVERRRGSGSLPIELLEDGNVRYKGTVELAEDKPVVQYSVGR